MSKARAGGLKGLSGDIAAIVAASGSGLVQVRSGRRRGTGVVWSADGLVVTAARAVSRRAGTLVTTPDGRELKATVVGRDHGTDVALLRVEAEGLEPLGWAPAGELAPGQLVLALGRPGEARPARCSVSPSPVVSDPPPPKPEEVWV